ncbi:putative protein-glutamine gamma-glutamyltransferase 2-like [Scophthalmus maximus]|uniref:Uncharacterized protein n=1 Tax=Scophthalmus maximus TaxID=52904 RepID=A0A2U9B096_SCOMX|nr:putative protein-glutamine gamma-glutamyltransferase 2-like [Scophthalmus maximus]
MSKFGSVEGCIPEFGPNATWRLIITTTPVKLGLRMVIADLDCSAFRDVLGSCIVDVKP